MLASNNITRQTDAAGKTGIVIDTSQMIELVEHLFVEVNRAFGLFGLSDELNRSRSLEINRYIAKHLSDGSCSVLDDGTIAHNF